MITFLTVAHPASAIEADAIVKALGEQDEDCDNYGNIVTVIGDRTCTGRTDCENYGIHANIGGEFQCSNGDCVNHGVVVSAGTYCGFDGAMLCFGDVCITGSPMTRSSTTKPDECVPSVVIGDHGRLEISCDPGGSPCGIAQEPGCWTVRYLCASDAMPVILYLYDELIALLFAEEGRGPWDEPSSCEKQPGA